MARIVCEPDPAQAVYETARKFLATLAEYPEAQVPAPVALAVVALNKAVMALEELADESDKLDCVRAVANNVHGSDELEIGSTGTHHNGSDGYWALAWAFVPNEAVDLPQEDEECSGT